MPDELRERLAESAAHNGRSLNTELVSRRQESLDPPHRDAGRRSGLVPRLRGGASSQGERSMQSHARRRVFAVGALAAVAVALAATLALVRGSGPTQTVSAARDELPAGSQLKRA